MDRAEKRRIERVEKWFNSLSEDKKQAIYKILNDKIESNNEMLVATFDVCIVCALDDSLNIDSEKIKEIMHYVEFYVTDYFDYFKKEGNGGFKMIEDEEVRNKVKEKIDKYIKGKMPKSKGLKLIRSEFNLPYAEISDMWLECKSEKCTNVGDKVPEHHEASKEIAASMEIKKQYDLHKEAIEKTKNKPVPAKKNGLKVIKTTTVIEGEYGVYVKSNDGVKVGNDSYTDKSFVIHRKNELVNNYNTKVNNIKLKIDALNKELKDIHDSGTKEIEQLTELESVFDM